MLDEVADDGPGVWGIPVPVNVSGARAWPDEVKAIATSNAAAGDNIPDIGREAGVNTSPLYKRLNGKSFVWPKAQPGPLTLTKVQFEALFSGSDWRDLPSAATRNPSFV